MSGDQNKVMWVALNREINNIPLRFSEQYTKWFMQISWSEACDKLENCPVFLFHPMHAGTRSGPWEGEKMDRWIELILGKKNNSTGKILAAECYASWTAGNAPCSNIGTLLTDCVFPFLSEIQLWVSGSEIRAGERLNEWAEIIRETDPEQKRPRFSPLFQ